MTLPFQARFTELDEFQERWCLGLLGLAFLTVGVTRTPVAIHRRLFHLGVKPRLVSAAPRGAGPSARVPRHVT